MDPVFGTRPIDLVEKDMKVVDATGDEIGTVEYVRSGDPEAVTTEGNRPPQPGLVGIVGRAVFGDEREPDVPEPMRSRLMREGFAKVDGPGFLRDQDRYVRADRIASVADGVVRLAVRRDELIEEI